MCESFRKTELKQVYAYKVVAKHKKTGAYHSFMTGNKYPDKDTDMPVWCSEKKTLTPTFSKILPGNINRHRQLAKLTTEEATKEGMFSWKKEQAGKTGAFVLGDVAFTYHGYVKTHFDGRLYDLVVVRVKLSKDLSEARLDGATVFCGKRIEILKEVY